MRFLKFYLMWAASSWFGLLHAHKYCPVWDEALGKLLDKHEEDARVGVFTMNLGGVQVWTSNAFYGYGNIWEGGVDKRRPSLRNMYRLWLIQEKHRQYREQKERKNYERRMREISNG